MFEAFKKYIRKFFLQELSIYRSIKELPIKNWFEIHKTNDLAYLLKAPQRIGWKREAELTATWAKIHDEFLETFGINEKLRRIYEIKRDISVLKADMFLEKDLSKETLIELSERELSSLIHETSKSELHLVKAHVEKFMSRYIDEKVVTVEEYYSYLKLMEQANKP